MFHRVCLQTLVMNSSLSIGKRGRNQATWQRRCDTPHALFCLCSPCMPLMLSVYMLHALKQHCSLTLPIMHLPLRKHAYIMLRGNACKSSQCMCVSLDCQYRAQEITIAVILCKYSHDQHCAKRSTTLTALKTREEDTPRCSAHAQLN